MLIFSVNAYLAFWAHDHWGWFRFYEDPSRYGWVYLSVAPILLIILHDAYFYWVHRLMHHPRLFRIFHRVHHRSSSPTPFTIYSFHPLEAAVECQFVPIASLLLPIHPSTLLIFLVVTFNVNLISHLGYELYGPGFWKSGWSEVLTTATYHHLHHGRPRYNFGFYFRFWDRFCGTEDPRYPPFVGGRR